MKTVCIIGGGFSGTITALQLLRKNAHIKINLINSGYPVFKGVAFSTKKTEHLLNVPAGRMSAFPEEPDHFVNWLITQPEFSDHAFENLKKEFIPRSFYGDYLKEISSVCINHPQISIIHNKALNIEKIGKKYRITIDNHPSLECEYVVLAMGNYSPAPPKGIDEAVLKSSHYFESPWSDSYLDDLKPTENILLIGSGLSMIDCVLSLISMNFIGKIYSISPRGYFPQGNLSAAVTYPDFYSEVKDKSLLEVFRIIKSHITEGRKTDMAWQAIIDSFRPYAKETWLKLSAKDKRQFISHLRHIWGVARHRLPRGIDLKMKELIDSGQLEVFGGRLQFVTIVENGFEVSVKKRSDQQLETFFVSRIVNCTGPQINFNEINDEFVSNLLQNNIISANDLKMGIRCFPDGRVLNKEGEHVKNIYAVGSLLREVLWETTAVPELRVNAENVASQIVESIN